MLVRCKTCGRLPKRSSQANRLYWKWINAISERLQPRGEVFSPRAWHEYMKGHFIGTEELKLPNGKITIVTLSSADLDKEEFSDYTEKVIAWATEHDVWLEDEE